MAKTTWVILKQPWFPGVISHQTAHMVGFSSKKEAQRECDRLKKDPATPFTPSAKQLYSPHTTHD